MKLARGRRKNLEWAVATHADGKLSVALAVEKQALRFDPDGQVYTLIDAAMNLPLPIPFNGIEIEPRLILKVYVKPTKAQRERIQWNQLKALCKT